ncbi:MAG: hypothetical protein ABIJ04_05575, partial [Bacteroidota bacterium]
MSEFPKHIILPDKVYSLSAQRSTEGRAVDRILLDYLVELRNPQNSLDEQRTRLGASRELADDYSSYRLPVPIEWLLVRFLSHYVRTNSVHILSGPGGEVLKSTNFKDYLGKQTDDDNLEQTLRMIL